MANISIVITIIAFILLLAYSIYLTLRINSFEEKVKIINEPEDNPEKNIISILEEIQEGSEKIAKKTSNFPEITERLEQKIANCIQKVGISGVETFSLNDEKSDDTSVALLNHYGDGIIISFDKNNIIAIKSIEKGQSRSKLSKKEEEAINKALS